MRNPGDGAEMTFADIAKELGVSTQRAKQIYANAIRKLMRHHPGTMRRLMQLSELRQRVRSGEHV
jgi:DNA-directed RNA polymerase sigma subunit (sigma70/sigma32)